MKRAAAWGFVALIGGAPAAHSQEARPASLSATMAPATPNDGALTVGDRATVTLELAAPASEAGEPRFPTWAKSWGEAEVVAAGPVEKSAGSGKSLWRQRITVVAFRPGKVPLPPVAVVVPAPGGARTLSTPASLALEVSSVIAGDPKQAAPMPPAPPRPLPWGRRFGWTAAAMSAVALALGAWVFARKKPGEIAAAALPPLAELERELARIAVAVAGNLDEGAPSRIAAALSSALRRFLGREMAFPALESTTTEIQRRLRAERTPEAISRQGVDLLRRLDRIKFSRLAAPPPARSAGEAMLSEAIAAARSVAAGLDRHLHPEPAPDAVAATARAEGAR